MLRVLGMAVFGIIGCGRMAFDPDGGGAGPDGGAPCVGSLVRTCFSAPPAAMPMTVITGLDINTDTSPMCDQHNDKTTIYCVVVTSDFTLTSTAILRAHGARPLVLLSTGTISLQATARIDVSSRHAGPDPIGAGGNASTCLSGTPPIGWSGGYGGSFHGRGGEGKGAAVLQGGLPASGIPAPPESLRGGCPGGTGDGGTPGSSDGAGGDGGGVVALVAAKQIDLGGTINASGAGGAGGAPPRGGGGGGGSGGMIVLDTPMIVPGPDALLFASGGGGGGGTGGAQFGTPGSESPEPGRSGSGGLTGSPNGGGAEGSSGEVLNGPDAVGAVDDGGSGGGGGGGGGAGFIHAPGFPPGSVAPPST